MAVGFAIRTLSGDADVAWVAERHRALYALEQGWDDEFAELVTDVLDAFRRAQDSLHEGAWIAETAAGERAGCVMCVRAGRRTAKLRILLVEPRDRGRGIGRALVRRCVEFARHAGYDALELWTTADLSAARCLYEEAGFELKDRRRERRFGVEIVSEDWLLEL